MVQSVVLWMSFLYTEFQRFYCIIIVMKSLLIQRLSMFKTKYSVQCIILPESDRRSAINKQISIYHTSKIPHHKVFNTNRIPYPKYLLIIVLVYLHIFLIAKKRNSFIKFYYLVNRYYVCWCLTIVFYKI